MENQSELRKLQLCEFDILCKFIDICEKNNLRYFMLGGTLLGAIRHKGFIPWDDDVDVCMPREDYYKLLDIAQKEMDAPYYITSAELDDKYRYCFGRIANSNIKIKNNSANIPRIEDAWIDIIPLDGMPEGKLKLKIHKLKLFFCRSMNQIAQYEELVDQKRKRKKLEALLVKIAGWKVFRKSYDYHKCIMRIQKQLSKYKYDDCETVINYMAAYGFKETFSKSWFGEGKEYEFESRVIKGPADYDSVCRQIYGADYMTPPPLDDRNKHNAEIIQ